ncbi:site-specific integrase [Paraburkholderia tuberum]|uniref:Site-specific recombinase XerD n=1 Tax=Paraburkholderia tuberum TaxID=157910 RepID=A0A1H1KL38_9BURK|nr:site-specific integrase [Paraburkholderia tuberum]SDR63048.1 Site-specific recombinase XerD [Paraburkholderia tuberum]
MDKTDVKVWRLLHAPVGPLAAHIDPFAEHLSEQGYNRFYIGEQLRFVARFSCWLKANHIHIDGVAEAHAKQFVARYAEENAIQRGFPATIFRLIAYLRQRGAILDSPVVIESTNVQRITTAYSRYLRDDQGLSTATCVQYVPFAEQFLANRFGTGTIRLSALHAADVISFIRQQSGRLSPARARCATIALRSFMRYLNYRGDITLDLAAAVPAVPNWSMTAIPRAMPAEHVSAVLASCRRDTSTGRRDYAILLLLARLGLRSSEIVQLTLDCIDWERGSLTVLGKGGSQSILPIPTNVGEAIADYLQHGRPRCNFRALFLCANAPVRGFGSPTSIASIVYAAVTRAGINAQHRGTHQFRHALACEMLRHGASLPEIGSLLRHQHSKTTGIYAKVDFGALRPLAQPWPGEPR